MGEDEESTSAMTPVSRSGGRVRCYAPIPHPPQLPELSERVQTCLENGTIAHARGPSLLVSPHEFLLFRASRSSTARIHQ